MKILGTGSALPEFILTNDMLAEFLDTSDEWIVSHTGIRERRVITTETLTDLAASAVRSALESAGMAASALDFIICSTVQGDAITPALACQLQGAIGATCPAVDLNAACCGFVYALDMAQAYIDSGKAARILIVSAEALSRIADWSDRSTCVLFGDGAGAAIVGAGDGLIATRLTTQWGDALYSPAYPGNSPYLNDKTYHGLRMAGQDVFKFAVAHSIADIKHLSEQTGIALDDIDHYFIHQANLRIVDAVKRRLKQPDEKFPITIHRTGNTSCATIPIMLDEANRAGALQPGQLLMMSAFGAGMTTGAAVLRW